MKMPQLAEIILSLGIGFLSVGTVAKQKDPITMTQTDPVRYEEKEKEKKEGKKGPPMPTIELYPRHRFLIEGPIDKSKQVIPTEEEANLEFWLEEDEPQKEKEDPTGEEFKPRDETDDTW